MKTILFLHLNELLTGLNSWPHIVTYLVLFNQFTISSGSDSCIVSIF